MAMQVYVSIEQEDGTLSEYTRTTWNANPALYGIDAKLALEDIASCFIRHLDKKEKTNERT